ncbi:MAG: NAD(P)H-hydrate dehydratase [Christensenellales bacterium]
MAGGVSGAANQKPCVLDADALNALAKAGKQAWPYLHNQTILTPHPAELARLLQIDTGAVLQDAMGAAEALAMSTGAVVLCKNASTIIAGPKYTAVVTQGCAGMAKGGSGDVLAGCMGGLLAQGYSAFDSACMAAYICGKAGEMAQQKLGPVSMLPTDTIENIAEITKQLCRTAK